MDFKTRLKELRIEKGMTAKDLVVAIDEAAKRESPYEYEGTRVSKVYNWESGTAKPNVDKLILICKVLHVSPDYLLGFTDSISTEPNARTTAEYLGVSDKTVQAIRDIFTFKADLRPFHLPIKDEVQPFIEAVIQTDSFRSMFDGYTAYINHFIRVYSENPMDEATRYYLENTPHEAFSMITVSAYKAAEDIKGGIQEYRKTLLQQPSPLPETSGKNKKSRKRRGD